MGGPDNDDDDECGREDGGMGGLRGASGGEKRGAKEMNLPCATPFDDEDQTTKQQSMCKTFARMSEEFVW